MRDDGQALAVSRRWFMVGGPKSSEGAGRLCSVGGEAEWGRAATERGNRGWAVPAPVERARSSLERRRSILFHFVPEVSDRGTRFEISDGDGR